MEKRKHQRFKTRQFAKVSGKLGVVNDMSDNGIQVATSLLPKKRKIEIAFETSGELILLSGLVQWIRRKDSKNRLNRLGVQLQDPPSRYREFINSLI